MSASSGARRAPVPVGLLLAALAALVLILLALVGPWIAPHPLGKPVGRPYAAPTAGLPFGTDHLGRDVLSQVLHGGRRLVLLPLAAALAVVMAGGTLGLLLGYRRGRAVAAVARLLDLLMALPAILVLLVLISGWGASSAVIVAVFLLVGVPYTARYTRAATQRVVTSGFVEHAVAMGERSVTVLRREVLPNVAGPLLADAGLRLIGGIYLVATASFLGFGPSPPATDWAQMISENIAGGVLNSWSVLPPTLLIAALAVTVNLLADRLERRIAR